MGFAVNHAPRPSAAVGILVSVFAVTLSGCATVRGAFSEDSSWSAAPQRPEAKQSYRTPEQIALPLNSDEKAVLASARTLIGRAPESKVNVNGRTFVLDCIGTVSAIFYGMNIDVQRDFRRYSGDGVSRLYQSLKAMHSLHKDLYPRSGDIIFWDNTWDARPLTHAGVVMSVDRDGTIHYVHEHIIKGVTVEAMNLLHPRDYYDPQGRIINNAIAMNSGISRRDNPPHWMSGDLWDSFGDILRVRGHFEVAEDRGPPEEVLLAMKPPDQW